MHNPKLYQQCNTVQRRDTLACLEKYAPKLKWKKNYNKIIDVGSGDGSVTKILEKFIPTDFKLLGCDISENMVNFANEHHRNKQKSFMMLDIAGNLPEELKKSFDHVFSFYALNWVTDQNRAFGNIVNLLDQNGECLMILAGHHTINEGYRILSRINKWSTWVHHVEKYISPYHNSKEPDREITKLMEDVGFVDIHVECRDMVFSYDDEDIMKKHTIAVNPFKIPENMHDDFIKDFARVLKDLEIKLKGNTSPEIVTLCYKLLIVYGRKPTVAEMRGLQMNN